MKVSIKSFFAKRVSIRNFASSSVLAVLAAMLMMSLPIEAMAQTITMPFIDGVGCQVANWMKGPLAVLVFILVLIATFIVGLITKMDWGRIITVAVVFGLIQGIVTLLLTSGRITLPSCLSV